MADTGLPTTFSANAIFIPETGIEGNNGFTFVRSGSTFIGISDAVTVPEPGSWVLLGLGGLGLLGSGYRRRKQAA